MSLTMKSIIEKLLTLLTGADNLAASGIVMPKIGYRPHKVLTERELIQKESEIGAELFGPIPEGHDRQFFNLDESTWIWYEQWTDSITNRKDSATIRYEIHPNGILKVQEGAKYSFLEGHELNNFIAAIQLYYERVMREVYHSDPESGEPLSDPITT